MDVDMIKKMTIKEGDVLLVQVSNKYPHKVHKQIYDNLSDLLPKGTKVMMIGDDVNFSIISQEDATMLRLAGN